MNKELAIRLCAAYLSSQMGIGIEYQYKKLVKEDAPIGPFWLQLADDITAHMQAQMSACLPDPSVPQQDQ
jgi:hypothetical protein